VRESVYDPENATCCKHWITEYTVNLFVLSVAKSQALNSRFVEGVERRSLQHKHTHKHTHTHSHTLTHKGMSCNREEVENSNIKNLQFKGGVTLNNR